MSMNFPAASFVWFFVPLWRVLPVEILVFVRGDPPPQRGGPPAAATSRGLALSCHLAHPTLESDFNKGFKRPTSGSIITSRPNAHFVNPLSGRQCVPTDRPEATSYTLRTNPQYQSRPLDTWRRCRESPSTAYIASDASSTSLQYASLTRGEGSRPPREGSFWRPPV